jgi:PTS system nitrogen regulatory IIA component
MTETLKERLEKSCFAPQLAARDKRAALEEMAGLLVSGGAIAAESRAEVVEALVAREGKMSTGMQYGVAIPHAKTDRVSRPVTAVAISQEGIDFSALDGNLSHIFVATISPLSHAGSHIRFLADISRKLASKVVREKLLEAKTLEEMVAAICDDVEEPE